MITFSVPRRALSHLSSLDTISLSSVYFCSGDCVEDVTIHLMPHLSLHPTLRTCSSDTILRCISELATANTTYASDKGKSYDFNTASRPPCSCSSASPQNEYAMN